MQQSTDPLQQMTAGVGHFSVIIINSRVIGDLSPADWPFQCAGLQIFTWVRCVIACTDWLLGPRLSMLWSYPLHA